MTSTYPIAPDIAKRAAADYLAIRRAGLLDALENEINETVEAHRAIEEREAPRDILGRYLPCRRFDDWQNANGWYLREPIRVAANLAALLDCPQHAIEPHIVPELLGENTKRTIVLDCLRNMANYARKELAKEQRAARRSA